MRVTDLFIKRPIFSASLSLLLLAIGLISFQSLTVRQYPKMDANIINIQTSFSGANASTVESFVTTKIENAIAGVDNIDYITSQSSAGESDITINLTLNADVNSALEDVNSDLSSVLRKLPDGIDDPIVRKVDPDNIPAIMVGFSSSSRTPEAVTDYITRVIIPQITTISGVGSADTMGNRTYAMRIRLDPKKMAALGVTGNNVEDALNDNNIQAQPGEIDRNSQILTIDAKTDLSTEKGFGNLVIKHDGDKIVQFKDIGTVELGAEDEDSSLYIEGKTGVGIGISVKSDANPLEVSKQVKAKLTELSEQMPKDMSMFYARDSSEYIESSIDEVVHTIIEATLFVLIVIFCFIGSLRTVLIPIVTIPLSLIGAFVIMFALGYSINTLTLLAFVLAIGMVVDDAIVVLENIHRHVEKGMKPFDAAIKGAREISFAVIAMTFTLAAVYAPIGFTTGYTSILFKEFAFTLAGTVVLSGCIALTLSPMMCSKIMKNSTKEGRLEKRINAILSALTRSYTKRLTRVLESRSTIIIGLIGVIIIGIMFFIPMQKQSTLAPAEDQGVVIGMAQAPTSASVEYTAKYTAMLNPIYKTIPEASRYAVINGHPGGQNHAMTFLSLLPWDQRERTAQEIQQELTQKSSKIPGVQFMFFSPGSLPGSNSMYPVEFVVKTTGSYEELNAVVQKLMRKLTDNPGVQRAQTDLKLDMPEIQVDFNRNKASILGITMDDINTSLNIALGQPDITSFDMDGQTYNVIPQVQKEFRDNPNALNNINVATESGELIPLANLVTISDIVAPSSLNHFQQQRSATINLVLNEGYSEQEAIQMFEEIVNSDLGDNMSYDFAGDTRQFITAGSSMANIFLFAIMFIFLVLSAQFESFTDPLIVLFTVPLSLVGALFTLYFTGGSLNIYTEIGLVTLVGLISKHGILIVEFANQLQITTGKTKKQAVIEAASVRLRPILMTTFAMVLGACPLVLATGAGAESRSEMGWTIMGGMSFGTLLTLFVIPTIYSFLARDRSNHTA